MIKENAIHRLLLLRHRKGNTELLNESLDMAIEALRQPEWKTGEWEEIAVIADACDISGVKTWASKMKCDQCGFTTFAIEGHFSQYNFCPKCGCYNGENGARS